MWAEPTFISALCEAGLSAAAALDELRGFADVLAGVLALRDEVIGVHRQEIGLAAELVGAHEHEILGFPAWPAPSLTAYPA